MSNIRPNHRPQAVLAQVMEDPFEEVRTHATVEAQGKWCLSAGFQPIRLVTH